MTNQHPITPPPELVLQWYLGAKAYPPDQWVTDVATQAARWGADQELEACATYVAACGKHLLGNSLMCARRPKPPSLKEQALQSVKRFESGQDLMGDLDTIRRALEALPNG